MIGQVIIKTKLLVAKLILLQKQILMRRTGKKYTKHDAIFNPIHLGRIY
jgi:hypothetical protein